MNDENLTSYVPGQSGNPAGRPKGARSRSTIVREWLEVQERVTNEITGLDETLQQQDIMTLALIKKARAGDVNAYKELMDSAHGKIVEKIDHNMKKVFLIEKDSDERDEPIRD